MVTSENLKALANRVPGPGAKPCAGENPWPRSRHAEGKRTSGEAELRFMTIAAIPFSSSFRASSRGAGMRCGISFSPKTWDQRATPGG